MVPNPLALGEASEAGNLSIIAPSLLEDQDVDGYAVCDIVMIERR